MQVYESFEGESKSLLLEASALNISHFALGAAVTFNDEILIVQRSANEVFLPGFFELPGGRMEKDESLLEGLTRELYEETGLEPDKVICYLDTFDFLIENSVTVRQFNFLIEPTHMNIHLSPTEHDAFQWIKKADLTKLNLLQITPAMKKSVISALHAITIKM